MTKQATSRRRRGERGAVTLWVLGLAVAVLFLGGLAVDLWRTIAVRRDLVAMADTAARAGASGLDEGALRTGELRLDPRRAERLARSSLATQSDRSLVVDTIVDADPDRVHVTLAGEVDFTLLGVFLAGDPVSVRAGATAEPRRVE